MFYLEIVITENYVKKTIFKMLTDFKIKSVV